MKTTKVTVTALKAPWPEGVQLGHVVSFKGEPPAWAQGKFTEAPEGVKADFAYEPPEPAASGVIEPVAQQAAEAQVFIDGMRTRHAEEVNALRDQLDAGGKALQEALDANTVLSTDLAAAKEDADKQKAQVADLRAKLDDAEKALATQKPAGGKKA